jgi:hypothetical protein
MNSGNASLMSGDRAKHSQNAGLSAIAYEIKHHARTTRDRVQRRTRQRVASHSFTFDGVTVESG